MRERALKTQDEGNRMAVWTEGVKTAYLNPDQASKLALMLLTWAEGVREARRRGRGAGSAGKEGAGR